MQLSMCSQVFADIVKVRIKMKSCQIRVRPNSKCLYKRQKRTQGRRPYEDGDRDLNDVTMSKEH